MEVIYEDAVILVYHLDVMQKNVRDNFVREQGMKGFKLIKTYKNIIRKIEKEVMLNLESEEESITVKLSKDEQEMLKEFLSFLVKKIEGEHFKEQQEPGVTMSTIDDHPAFKPLQTVLYMLLIKESKASVS